MVSSCSSTRSLKRLDNDVPFVCNSAAFLDMTKYGVPLLTSKSDKEFHVWAKNNLVNYSKLKDGYENLSDCVKQYHPDTKPKFEE